MSQHSLLHWTIFLLFLLEFSFFHTKPAKQKVSELKKNSIKMNHKLIKGCYKNGLKIDEFRTNQIPPNLKFCLSPSKENKKFFLS